MLVLLGAVALTASYPPFPLPFLSFLAITPAVLLIRHGVLSANPRAAFRWGWWYGLVSNAFVLYWMIVALWHFTPLSALGYFGTISVLEETPEPRMENTSIWAPRATTSLTPQIHCNSATPLRF